ncbi:hypothetical protein SLA2020_134270 [Shorea laevis]
MVVFYLQLFWPVLVWFMSPAELRVLVDLTVEGDASLFLLYLSLMFMPQTHTFACGVVDKTRVRVSVSNTRLTELMVGSFYVLLHNFCLLPGLNLDLKDSKVLFGLHLGALRRLNLF